MRKFILASHGMMADGMKNTVEMIAGKKEEMVCLSLQIGHHPDELKNQIETWVLECPNDEFIILCDVFGGSVANAIMHLCTYTNVHVITGMNVGLVIALCTANEVEPTSDIIHQALDDAKKYMLYTNELLEGKEAKK